MHDPLPSLPFAREATDRDDAARGRPGLLARLWADPDARVLCLRGDRALRDAHGLDLRPPLELGPAAPAAATPVYLGRTLRDGRHPAGTAVLSIDLDEATARRLGAEAGAWADLRSCACELDELEQGLFATALAMRNWHEAHGFSPRTGVATVPESAGWVRRAPGEEHAVFPRTDAAVIAAVVDGAGRILLGANVRWRPRRFSLLAGFVEPGESFEAAVAREVMEEAGVRIVRPRYLGSQPWPFPASVMVGFGCELAPDQDPEELRPDPAEIAELRWWTREQIAAQPHLLPPRPSIARVIIEEWYGGPLGG